MKVLVTGAAGFIGRHLVEALVLQNLSNDVTAVDIAHRPYVDALDLFHTDDTRFDVAFHCAAVQPHRHAIDTSPITVGAGCLELDAAMFRWAQRTKPGRLVYFSSSAAYPIALQGPGSETSLAESMIDLSRPGGPDAIYGWVKLTGENLAARYREQGGAVTVLRPFSGFGEDQPEQWPFGAFIGRAQRREDPFTIWGDGNQVRDWIHVDDIVAATFAAIDQDVPGPVNLSTGRATSFNELAALVCQEAGYEPELKHVLDAPQGVAYRVGDPTKLHTFYRPKVELEEGIARALKASV